ncbi:hypothetical protein BV20DRAFT_963956 [Pilatotrama ljubarskyi]|nr:hypothetical protein BV20DRAFT_963956 [Pilatotrama ljubarskyi]
MRFSTVLALAAAVSSASAAGVHRRQSYPDCATPCLASADFGSCDPVDDSCLCKSQSFIDSVTKCIVGACQGDQLQAAESAAQSACASVGVTLTSSLPAASSTSPAGSSGSGSSTPAASSTSAAAPSTTSNAASSRGVNALAALVAVGAAALAL